MAEPKVYLGSELKSSQKEDEFVGSLATFGRFHQTMLRGLLKPKLPAPFGCKKRSVTGHETKPFTTGKARSFPVIALFGGLNLRGSLFH